MLRTFAAVTLVTLGLIPLSGAQSIRKAVDPEIEAAVMRVLDDFLVGLNNGDLAAQQRAMHFPHYRLANGTMTVLDEPWDGRWPGHWNPANRSGLAPHEMGQTQHRRMVQREGARRHSVHEIPQG